MGGNPVPVGTERKLPDGTVEQFQGKGPGYRWTRVSKSEPTGIGQIEGETPFTSAQLLPALFSPLLRPQGVSNALFDNVRKNLPEEPDPSVISNAEISAIANTGLVSGDDDEGIGQLKV